MEKSFNIIKILKVKKLSISPCNVYDLTSNKYSNFTVESGIVVHNSKDMSDAVCGSVYNTITNMAKYRANLSVSDYSNILSSFNKPNNIYEMITKLK